MTLTIDGTEYKVSEEVANLVLLISKERDTLKDFATWVCCGHDYRHHEYYCDREGPMETPG